MEYIKWPKVYLQNTGCFKKKKKWIDLDKIICQNVYDPHISTCKKRGRKRKRQIVRKEDRNWLTQWTEMNRLDAAAAAAKSLQSCPTLCNPIDGSPPGSPIHGILQARTLEWVAISFSNAWKWKVKVKSLSHVQLLVTLWTVAYQAPPSMGFSRQEYWSGLPLLSPETLLSLHY